MVTYFNLEKFFRGWNGEIGVFGAGELGKNAAYDLLKSAGHRVDFYFDNYVTPETVIRDNVKVKELEYLYKNKDTIKVILAVSSKNQNIIANQLSDHGVKNIFMIDTSVLSQIMESVDKADDIVKTRYHALYDNKEYLAEKFRKATGYELNFDNPQTFNEKLQWLKLYDHNPDYTTMADKLTAKRYVADKVGEEYVVPLLGVWDKFEHIDFNQLPEQFVLKCTHDSGSVVLVKDKEKLDYEMTKTKLNIALSTNYYWVGREWPYKNIKKRIIAEPYMENPENMADYKFLCFHGKVKMIFTCTERFERTGLKVTFFDLNWKKQNFERHYPASSKEIDKPKNLELMIELAEQLSQGIPFVRVDFYEIKGRVYFGEMTFFPGGGMEEFRPEEWDTFLGKWIELPLIDSRRMHE